MNLVRFSEDSIFIFLFFLETSPKIDVEIAFSLRVWHVFDVAFSAVGAFIKHKLTSDVQRSDPDPKHKFN